MNKYYRIFLSFIIVFVLIASFGTGVDADTGVRYNTFTESNDRLVRTQTAYVSLSTKDEIYGVKLGPVFTVTESAFLKNAGGKKESGECC